MISDYVIFNPNTFFWILKFLDYLNFIFFLTISFETLFKLFIRTACEIVHAYYLPTTLASDIILVGFKVCNFIYIWFSRCIFHIHKIGIFFIINQISFHTEYKLNFWHISECAYLVFKITVFVKVILGCEGKICLCQTIAVGRAFIALCFALAACKNTCT